MLINLRNALMAASSSVGSLLMNGTNSSASYLNTGYKLGRVPLSYSLWVKPYTYTPSRGDLGLLGIMGKTGSRMNGIFSCLRRSENYAPIQLFQSVWQTDYFSDPVSLNEWHHIGFSCADGLTINFFLDGKKLTQTNGVSSTAWWTSSSFSSTYICIGCQWFSGTIYDAANGKLANINLWINRALGNDEMIALSRGDSNVPTDATHQWLFEDVGDNVLHDTETAGDWNIPKASAAVFSDLS